MARLSKRGDLFNDRQDIRFADVECPEWGEDGQPLTVRVRGLTGTEADAYEGSLILFGKKGEPRRNTDRASGRLAVMGIVDEAGRRVFTDDDAAQVGDKNAAALKRVCEKIRELSGMGEDALEKAKGN